MKKIFILLQLSFVALSALAQVDKKPVISIQGKDVPSEEFIYVYEKNNSKQKNLYTIESLQESLNLFINYRLKIQEAESRKMDTLNAFKTELEGYRKQLAKPYMTDESFLEKMTFEAYERLKTDVNTSHILFMCEEYASPEDTLKVYAKALAARKKILAGADFGQTAIELSEDPSAKEAQYPKGYKGYLGYNPAFSFVYPYESASYNTPVGQVSMPFRTKYGYHIIKVNEKRINEGEVKVKHIMIEANDGIDAQDSIAKRQLAFDIYNKLKEGGNWDELCKQHSTDKRTSESGGEMPPFQLDGRLRVPSFEKAAFALKNPNDISEPIKSPYGWHIIKLVEKIPAAPFEDLKKKLMKDVKNSDRFSLNESVLYAKLKKENNFKESVKAKSKLTTFADSSLVQGSWVAPKSAKRTTKLFTINKQVYNYGNFFDYAEQKHKTENKGIESPSYLMSSLYEQYVNESVYNYVESHLAEKHKDYRLLLKEFRDGILFFDIMQKEVWGKASSDTTGIKSYYELNKEKYVKPNEINATVYKASDAKVLDQIDQLVSQGKTADQIKEIVNKDNNLNVNVETKNFEEGKESWMQNLGTKDKIRITDNGAFTYVVVNRRIPSSIKPLNQCRGLVISDYQNVVEKEWVDSLKKKYPVTIYQETINNLVKK